RASPRPPPPPKPAGPPTRPTQPAAATGSPWQRLRGVAAMINKKPRDTLAVLSINCVPAAAPRLCERPHRSVVAEDALAPGVEVGDDGGADEEEHAEEELGREGLPLRRV